MQQSCCWVGTVAGISSCQSQTRWGDIAALCGAGAGERWV